MTSAAEPRTLIVLGGGGSLGAYQSGALLALLEGGVVPDALFGCSAGGLNAAFLAASPTVVRARELAAWWADSSNHRVMAPGLRAKLQLPHVADAWAAGLLPRLPTGPRDFARTADLVAAGHAATAAWLARDATRV